MGEHDVDRSEPATPFKLQKARQQGQTARSMDAQSCAVFLAAVLCLTWQGEHVFALLLRLARATLAQAGQAASGHAGLWPLVAELVTRSGAVLAPFFLALPLIAVLAAAAQGGMVFSSAPLHVDFARIHPATGLRRMFSLRTLFEGVRACVKLVLLCAAAALAVRALFPQFHVLPALPPAAFLHHLVADLASLGWKMGAALALVAAIDILFTRREFGRSMRMSRRELKDEIRNREGDPRIRSRQRELRREQLKRSMALANTRTADVVLANPTHFAVALRYVHGEMEAPRVVAKGAGQLAVAIREIAARHRVVVVTNPPLARRLFREAPLDGYLPAAFHGEVARIFVWVLAMRQRQAGGKA